VGASLALEWGCGTRHIGSFHSPWKELAPCAFNELWHAQPDAHAGLELPPSDTDERDRVAQAIRALTLNPADPELILAFEDAVTSDAELSAEALALLVLALGRVLLG
jgi:hypothetical protein